MHPPLFNHIRTMTPPTAFVLSTPVAKLSSSSSSSFSSSFSLSIPCTPALAAARNRTRNAIRSSLTAPARAAAASKSPALPAPLRHFLHVDDFDRSELDTILSEAIRLKQADALNDPTFAPFSGRAMSMVFAKPSARTRVSFETAMYKSGGHSLILGSEVGVNTREAAKDISRVLSGMTDMIMARLYQHDDIVELAEHAKIPVINGLTDYNHPCQIVADAMTIMEHSPDRSIEGKKIVYVGDGNNIVNSWLELATRYHFHFVCCCPEGYEPDAGLLGRVRAFDKAVVEVEHSVEKAVAGADFIYTDVWASMGQKEEAEKRVRDFDGYQVDARVMKMAGDQCKFMHCLPAERGRECTDEVMEADYSIVFQQAENRMHAQLAIMLACMGWPNKNQ